MADKKVLELIKLLNTKGADIAPLGVNADNHDPMNYSAVEPNLTELGLGDLTPEELSGLSQDEIDAANTETLAERISPLEPTFEAPEGSDEKKNVTNVLNNIAGGTGLGALGAGLVANPVNIPGAYVLGKSIYDIKKASQDETSPLAQNLKNELDNAKTVTLEDPSNLVKFPETARAGAEIVGGNVVPKTASNLVDTLAKAFSGGLQGVSNSVKPLLTTGGNVVTDTQKTLAGLISDDNGNINPLVKILGTVLGNSSNKEASALASKLLTGHDITSPTRTGAVSGDAYITSLDQQATNIINTPLAGRTAEQIKFLESYPENRKSYLASMQEKQKANDSQQYRLDTGSLDPKSVEFREFNGYVDTKAQLKDVRSRIKKAIEANDANAIMLLGNQIAAIGSVANKQGVVNGEEVNRVMGAVQNAKQMINDGKWVGQDAVKMGRELWGGLNTFGDVVDGGINAKLQRYQKTYNIPDEFFTRAEIDIKAAPIATAADVITPERQDLAVARATAFDTLKRAVTTGETITTGVAALINGVFGEGTVKGGDKINLNKANSLIKAYYANEEKVYLEHMKNAVAPNQAEPKVEKPVEKSKPAGSSAELKDKYTRALEAAKKGGAKAAQFVKEYEAKYGKQ